MRIKEFLQNKAWQKWDKSQWTIIILTGILLMILAIPADGDASGFFKKTEQTISSMKTQAADTAEEASTAEYVENLERRLKHILKTIDGAGKVEVMITLEDLGESVVEKDSTIETLNRKETDSGAGMSSEVQKKSSQTTIYEEIKEGETPFVGKEITPKIAGILVVAQGGENTQVKQNISDAVVALFQIDVNRIKVVKMNVQEEKQ